MKYIYEGFITEKEEKKKLNPTGRRVKVKEKVEMQINNQSTEPSEWVNINMEQY